MGKVGFSQSLRVQVPQNARPNVSGAQLLFDGDGRIVVNSYLRSDDGTFYQGTIWLCNDDGTVARVLFNPGTNRHGQNLVAIHPYTGEAYVLGANQANPSHYWMDKVPNFTPVGPVSPTQPVPVPSDVQQEIAALKTQIYSLNSMVNALHTRLATVENTLKAVAGRLSTVEADPQLNEHHDWTQAKSAVVQYLQENQLPLNIHQLWAKATEAAYAEIKKHNLV